MTTYAMAGPADPRALLSAAALGSLAGLVLGGAYLAGGSARHTAGPVAWTELRTRELPASEPASPDGAAVATLGFLPRLRTAALEAATPPSAPAHTAAAPFQSRDVQTSASDQRCLTQAVYYEARGESAAGQEAVAQVVLNRVRHPAFPKSVCGVVFQRADAGCQFSFACDGRMKAPRDGDAWRRAQTVAQRALNGFVMRQVGEATHFHVFNIGPAWSAGLARIGQIGAHVFYGFSGHAGAARMFQAKAQPSVAPHASGAGAAEASPMAMASLGGDDATRVHAVIPAQPAAPPPPAPIPASAASPIATIKPAAAQTTPTAAPSVQPPVPALTPPAAMSVTTTTAAAPAKPTAS